MNKRNIIGRKIVDVVQTRVHNNGHWEYHIEKIILDGGYVMWFSVTEDDQGGEYIITASAGKVRKEEPTATLPSKETQQ